jgi:hypothetical protein
MQPEVLDVEAKTFSQQSAICHCVVSIVLGLHLIEHHHTKFASRFCVYVSYFSMQATGNTYGHWEK